MTYYKLALAILQMSSIDREREAVVWPPPGCPATDESPVTELSVVATPGERTNTVRILTGKTPA